MKQIDILRKMLGEYVDHHGLRPASRNLNVPIDVIKSINDGRNPLFLNAERVMDALGYDIVFQPRSSVKPDNSNRYLVSENLNQSQVNSNFAADAKALKNLLREVSKTLGNLQTHANVVAISVGGDRQMGGDKIRSALLDDSNDTQSDVADNDDQISEPSADYIVMPFSQDVRAAAGSGELVFEEAEELHIALPRSVVPAWTRLSGLICIRVTGDSMIPTLNDGDLLLLDRSHTEPVDGQLFVIHGDDGLLVKRLRNAGNGWELVSDNPTWSVRAVGTTDRIIGRVVWWGR